MILHIAKSISAQGEKVAVTSQPLVKVAITRDHSDNTKLQLCRKSQVRKVKMSSVKHLGTAGVAWIECPFE